jgi:hypothetical protein
MAKLGAEGGNCEADRAVLMAARAKARTPERRILPVSMPIGADVTAARAGIVRAIRDESPDDGLGYGEHNYVFIEHDGSLQPGRARQGGSRFGAQTRSGSSLSSGILLDRVGFMVRR